MSEYQSKRPRIHRPLQKPVFIIEPFNASNPEHLKGNMNLILNKALAFELCQFIRDSELTQDEGHIYAMQGHINRWFQDRKKEIIRLKGLEQSPQNTSSPGSPEETAKS